MSLSFRNVSLGASVKSTLIGDGGVVVRLDDNVFRRFISLICRSTRLGVESVDVLEVDEVGEGIDSTRAGGTGANRFEPR